MSRQGTVKSWSDEKGFGFIIPTAGGGDVFVHRNVIGVQCSLVAGKPVKYESKIENDKPKATAVTGEGVQKRFQPMGTGIRQIGYVKNINQEKGYGFLSTSDGSGQDIFVLCANIQGTVTPGTKVSYTIGTNPKNSKPWAEHVIIDTTGMSMPAAAYGGYPAGMDMTAFGYSAFAQQANPYGLGVGGFPQAY